MFENSQLQNLFSKKPTGINISEVKQLRTFIQNYPDDTLKPNLYKLLTNHKQYRKVNGDGNCFYRAIMFLYLRQTNLADYEVLFPYADLLKCKNLPFKVSKNMTSQHILQYLWQTQLLHLADQSPKNREKSLLQLINKSLVIDSILVAYFRALNYDYLQKNRQEIQPYTDGGIQNDIERVLNYGKESEGVELYSLSKILNITIQITMVHQQNLTIIDLNKQANNNNIKLFYRPGHYDILCDQQQNQRPSSKIEKPFFSQYFNEKNSLNKNSNTDYYNLPFKSTQTTASRVISISKPSQIRLMSHPSQNSIGNNSRQPSNMTQFRQSIINGRQDKSLNSNKKNRMQKLQAQASKKQIQKKVQDETPKIKSIKIQSNILDKKEQDLKQRMLGEAVLCVVGVSALIVGVFLL